MTGPRRRETDHLHPEYWPVNSQHRFEDRLTREFHGLREDVEAIGQRLTWLLGGLAVLAFLFPFMFPFVVDLLNIPTVVTP